jgi:hypothetical protein
MNDSHWWGQLKGLFTKGELLVIALVCGTFIAVLLSLDPEWVLFAGSMSVGVLDPSVHPAPLFDNPRELFQVTDGFLLLGLVGLLLLMGITGEVSFGWLSRIKARLKAGASGSIDEERRAEIRQGASPEDIHLRM